VAENQPRNENRMHSDFVEMAGRVRDFMRRALAGEQGEEAFNSLALDLFSLQRKGNRAYGDLCEQRNVGVAESWLEIPAVPTVAFKQLELTSLAPAERTNVFFSSGTTQQDRSWHFHSEESLALYEESLWSWFGEVFARERAGVRWLFLTPGARQAPSSSLAHMFSTIAGRVGLNETLFVGTLESDGGWGLNVGKLLSFLASAEAERKPVAVLGTAFLFVHLLDHFQKAETSVRLPEGSWIMETGGYKGRSREVPKEELHRLLNEKLGVARDKVFGEYGMSELSSQAYAGADGLLRFPPWARARIISPATGRDAPEGERGLIRVYDLANVWSVMAVQTEDIGIKVGDAFRLVGRAAQAEARGCSLMTV
jgi:hypothetical protein